ncbi:MAG: hypothetical protein ACRERV_05015 [Methylococcales bacterium]
MALNFPSGEGFAILPECRDQASEIPALNRHRDVRLNARRLGAPGKTPVVEAVKNLAMLACPQMQAIGKIQSFDVQVERVGYPWPARVNAIRFANL